MQKLVQSVFQSFAGTEFWNFGSFDLDLCASLRISAFAGSAFANGECAKTNQGNCAAFFQGGSDCTHSRVKRAGSSSFGDVGMFGNMLNQFGFIHKIPLCLLTTNSTSI